MKKRVITIEHEGDDDNLRWALEIITEQVCGDRGCWMGFDEGEEGKYHYFVTTSETKPQEAS